METKETVVLDGKETTMNEVEEKKQDSNVRVVETDEGVFKTLNRMHG
jgi:hypothetical protein